MCLCCNFHSYSCEKKCSEIGPFEAQYKIHQYTGGHFIHKNEKGEYVHNILCDCNELKAESLLQNSPNASNTSNPPSPSILLDPFNVPLESLPSDDISMEDLGFEWGNSSSNGSNQTRIEDYFHKKVKNEDIVDEYVPDSWMDYESGSVEGDFASISDYNVNGIDDVALNNYVLDNLDSFDIEAFITSQAPPA